MFKQLAAEIAAVEGELEAVEAAIVALRPRLEESTARAADPFDDEARDASRVQGDPTLPLARVLSFGCTLLYL